MMGRKAATVVMEKDDATNGGAVALSASEPYSVEVTIEGTSDLFFNRWNAEDIDARAKSAKGSSARKVDNLESYVWRNDAGELCIPGEYLRMSMIEAARYQRDPTSPRASAQRLYKAGVIVETQMATLGVKAWDYEDRRRAQINRQYINKTRPVVKAGWQASFVVQVILPEYIDELALRETVDRAGKLVGVGTFRPTYGRFHVVDWSRIED